MVVGSWVLETIPASNGKGCSIAAWWCAHCGSYALVNMKIVDLLAPSVFSAVQNISCFFIENGANTSQRAFSSAPENCCSCIKKKKKKE